MSEVIPPANTPYALSNETTSSDEFEGKKLYPISLASRPKEAKSYHCPSTSIFQEKPHVHQCAVSREVHTSSTFPMDPPMI